MGVDCWILCPCLKQVPNKTPTIACFELWSFWVSSIFDHPFHYFIKVLVSLGWRIFSCAAPDFVAQSPDFLSHGNFPSKKMQGFHVQSELPSLVLDSLWEHSGKFIQPELEIEDKWVIVCISKMGHHCHHSPNGPINAQMLSLVTIGHDHSSNFAPQESNLITIFEA